MIDKLRRILRLDSVEDKLLKLNNINNELDLLKSNVDDLALEYTKRSESRKKLKESVSDDIIKSVDERFEIFQSGHLKETVSIKKEIDKLEVEKSELESDKLIIKALQDLKDYNNIKTAYKSNTISVEVFDTFLKAKQGKVKYADFLVFNEKGELLIIQRSKTDKSNPEKWVIPGGHVDAGEDFKTAALRELNEEAGININECEKVGEYSDKNAQIEYYKGNIKSDEQEVILETKESQDSVWINPHTDLDKYEMVFNMKDNIKNILGITDNVTKIKKSETVDIEKSDDKEETNHLKEMITEHERLIDIMKPHAKNDPRVATELGIQAKELKEYKKKLAHEQKEVDLPEKIEKAIESGALIGEAIELLKARAGVYANTAENRKKGRVGQKYGSKKEFDFEKIKHTVASTGSEYETYIKNGTQLKVRYSDHEPNVWKQDADLWLDISKKGTSEAKDAIDTAMKAKISNTETLNFGENKNALGYDVVERIGGFVYLKNKREKKYHKNQLGGVFRNNNKKIEEFKKIARKEGDFYFKEGYDTTTLHIKDFYSRYPNIKFNKNEVVQKAIDLGFITDEGLEILKARTGVYADNAQNRQLKRVGQKYGSSKQGQENPSKDGKQEEKPESKQQTPESLAEDAKNTSEPLLQEAIKNSKSPEVRQVAHNELKRRQDEEHPQEEKFGEPKKEDEQQKKEEKPPESTEKKKEESKPDKETSKETKDGDGSKNDLELNEEAIRKELSNINEKLIKVNERLKSELEGLSLFQRAKLKSKDKEYSTLSSLKEELTNHLITATTDKKKKEKDKKQSDLLEKEKSLNKDKSESTEHKNKQYDIVQESNPMVDDYHVGIRSPKDIKSFDETINDEESFAWGDFTKEDAEKALKDGEITVYSSKKIDQGSFVSTSKKQAEMYAGDGKVNKQKVKLSDVAWINGDEGQFASIDKSDTKEKEVKKDESK